MEQWLWFTLIGLAAGFLAGLVMKGSGFGLVGNLVVGVIGALGLPSTRRSTLHSMVDTRMPAKSE